MEKYNFIIPCNECHNSAMNHGGKIIPEIIGMVRHWRPERYSYISLNSKKNVVFDEKPEIFCVHQKATNKKIIVSHQPKKSK